jgi:hypothetical protein
VNTAPAPAPRRQPGALVASLATAVAVVTVLVSSMVLARDARRLLDRDWVMVWPWLVEFAAAVVIVAGAWSVRTTHPRASTGLAVAAAASLLPLWAAWPWLPAPVRAAVLAAAPVTVGGIAQVALGWPTQASAAARAARRAVFGLAGAAGLAHLLGYNPFADPGCLRICRDIPPPLGGLLTTRQRW